MVVMQHLRYDSSFWRVAVSLRNKWVHVNKMKQLFQNIHNFSTFTRNVTFL